MKTLKELLLERHQEAAPGLEQDCQQFLARLRELQPARPPERRGWERFWHEYLVPLRWHLAGMGAVWLTVLLLQLDAAPGPAAGLAKTSLPDSRQVLAALLQKRRELLELTAPPPVVFSLPPRRSEAAPTTAIG